MSVVKPDCQAFDLLQQTARRLLDIASPRQFDVDYFFYKKYYFLLSKNGCCRVASVWSTLKNMLLKIDELPCRIWSLCAKQCGRTYRGSQKFGSAGLGRIWPL